MKPNQTPPDLDFENYFFTRDSHLKPHLQFFHEKPTYRTTSQRNSCIWASEILGGARDVTGPWTLDTDGGVDLGKPDSRTLVGMTDFPGYLMYPLWTDVLTR